MKSYLTLIMLLQCFFLSLNLSAQAWEILFEHPLIDQSYAYIPYLGSDNEIRLAATTYLDPDPTIVYSFDENGKFLGENPLSWSSNWSIFNSDKSGASYWANAYKVQKIKSNGQIAWTYSPPDSSGLIKYQPSPNGGGYFRYYTYVNGSSQDFIDYINADGQLVHRFSSLGDIPVNYYAGHDSSLIYTSDNNTPGLRKWVKVDKYDQVVWQRAFNSTVYFYHGSTADGSTYACNTLGMLMKINALGNKIWEHDLKTFFPGSSFAEFIGMLVREDKSIILCVGNTSSSSDYIINFINLNPLDGSANWIRSLSNANFSPSALSGPMVEMPDGGILACFGPEWTPGSGYKVLLVRTDPSGNTLTNKIAGRIYQDENFNCTPDVAEKGLNQISVIAQSGTKKHSAMTDMDGNFSIPTMSGNYTLSFAQLGSYWNICDFQNPIIIDTNHDSIMVDIGAKATVICPELFVSIGSLVFRRCFDNNHLDVQYANYGTAPAENAYVTVTLDPKLIYLSATAPLLSQIGQTYKFDIGTVDIGETGSFSINFKVDCDATLGEELCVQSHIYPDTLCIPTAAALVSNDFCLPVVASYDPNDKTAFVNGKPETVKILPDLGLEYLIRFQNTGNDTAFNIVVADTLSSRLDPNSVVPGASSHPYTFELKDGNILRFNFRQILLPDSNTNEAASHGFVKFYIRQAPGNSIGSTLSNTAAITFDYNLPILTNESRLLVSTATGIHEPEADILVKAWPVPAKDRVDLLLPTGTASVQSWKLMNLTGQVLRTGAAEASGFSIRRNGLPGGIYSCQIRLENGATALARIVFE